MLKSHAKHELDAAVQAAAHPSSMAAGRDMVEPGFSPAMVQGAAEAGP